MLDPIFYLIPSIIMYSVYYFYAVRRIGFFSLDNLFILANFIMLQGIIGLLDLNLESDKIHANILIYTIPLFIFALIIGEGVFNRFRSVKNINVSITKPSNIVVFFIIISILITILYYQTVGYSVFLLGISSIFNDSEYDIATLRLESYAGNKYLFPGYVNQFKNIILPGLSVVYLTYAFKNKIRYRWIALLFLGIISLIGLLGTGQRGAFVIFIISTVAFVYFLNKKIFKRLLPVILSFSIPIFFMSSIVLDRNDAKSSISVDPISTVSILSNELYDRIFRDNQVSAIYGFRYVAYLDAQYGREWGESILGILPGERFRGSNLAGKIFQLIYGSDRGTSPIGIWGSVYYNFGITGGYIFPLILGLVYKFIYSRFSRIHYMNHGQLFGMSGIFITMGLWIADGPVTMLNTGLPGYIIIYLISSLAGIVYKNEL